MDRREYQKAYREANAEKRRAYQERYAKENREQLRVYYRDYWARNKDKKAAKGRRHYQNRKSQINDRRRAYQQGNLQARLAATLRSRLSVAIRGRQKGGSAISMLGCSIDDFKRYIEIQFEHGMTWDNWGEWHIDHIRPLDSFDLTIAEDVSVACHYTNMQPMWSRSNLSKGSKPFRFYSLEGYAMSQSDLWCGMRIPIILVSGGVNSGKTLFGLTIDPNTRRQTSETEPTTISWDQEGSADPYEGGLNFEHKDTRAAIGAGVHLQKFPSAPEDPRWRKILLENADVNDHPAASLFRAWYLSLLKVEPGKYRVGICDTFTPIQDGLVEWVKRHPEAFGCTHSQFEKAASMFMWPVLKAILSHILTIDCRLRFQTFVLNVHLKNEWAAGAKTGRQVAEGLDVLEKLATLHLELDRSPKEKGKEAPRVPSAIVKKERLVRFSPDGNDLPILPPRVPICTPDAIRGYIMTPPDFSRLDAGERLPDQSMSDDERLRIQAAIAENNRAAEESKVSALEMARRAMEQGRAFVQSAPATATIQATDAPVGNEPVSSVKTDAAGPVVCVAPITEQQAKEMLNVMKQLFTTGKDAMGWLQSNYQASDPGRLTTDQAADAIIRLTKDLAEKKFAATKSEEKRLMESQPANHDPNGPATVEQRARVRDLTIKVYGDKTPDAQREFLQSLGINAAASMTYCQAMNRIAVLEGYAVNGIPF
jgi:hypothetical protein